MSSISPEYVLKHSGEAITDLEFWKWQQMSSLIAACGGKAGVDVWNLNTRRPFIRISSEIPMLSACGFSTGELLTLDKDGNLKLFDINKSSEFSKLHLTVPEVGFCKAAVLSEDVNSKKIVAVPGETKSSVNVWNLTEEVISRQLIPSVDYKLGMPWGIKLLYSTRQLAIVGYEDGSIFIWDIHEEKVLSKASLFSEPVMCFDAYVDNQNTHPVISGVAGSVDDFFIKWKDISETERKESCALKSNISDISVLNQQKILNSGLSCIRIRNDRKIVVSGGWDHKIRIFSWKNLKPLAVLDYHKGQVQAISFSHDQLLACGSQDNKISIWKIY